MKYVDDLGKVKPEEIQHIDGQGVHAIVKLPGEQTYPYLIVYDNGHYSTYTADGSPRPRVSGLPMFIYKPKKVKYLKSIRQILEENPDAYFDECGDLCCKGWGDAIVPQMYKNFGKPLKAKYNDDYNYGCPKWIEEREETNDDLHDPNCKDLVEVKPRIKKTVWVNVYNLPTDLPNEIILHPTRDKADKCAGEDRIACLKLELDFEEGEGL